MRYFLIAGEASGDLHASNLMRELKMTDPEADFCFLGGDLMQAVGGEMVKHYRNMAFMGFVAVLKNLKTVLRNIEDCKKAVDAYRPDVLILIDYPSFNLRIAQHVKETSQVPVYYYIPPKIWAWKEYRIKDIKKYINKVFTIFPFETEFYKKHNYEVTFVGNPTVDSIAYRPLQEQTFGEFCTKNRLPDKPIIALLAGSRKQEISYCLPRMIEAASRFKDYQIVISGAPGIDTDFYAPFLSGKDVPVVFGQTYELAQHAAVAIVNSGTATLETALIGTPQVVVYYVMLGRLAYVAKNIFLKIKYISLVNLVSGRETVKELIAHKFTVENIASEIEQILNNESYRKKMLTDYQLIKERLGSPGTANKAANIIFKNLCSLHGKLIPNS
jgi:lipid-A-disaccharide synthase